MAREIMTGYLDILKEGKVQRVLKDNRAVQFRRASLEDWDEAVELAYRVFKKYEAAEYGEEGEKEFVEFLNSPILYELFKEGRYVVYVAVADGDIVGMISLRNGNFISLLFVDERFHNRGIGSALLDNLIFYLKSSTEHTKVYVHSSPYAEGFYHRYGFVNEGGRTSAGNIIYTPMSYEL
ncbi:MAG: GNAT family N-acetyltransferase [Lachnospiraceae bacterium]|nr:GNAT family N-acetyltransferase [Lachnospiraceae bacterium]